MAPGETRGTGGVVDLGAGAGSGPLWGMASHDLNATLLAWPPGHAVAEHVNPELDVLVVVLDGGATVTIDDAPHELRAPAAILIPRGTRRAIRAGDNGTTCRCTAAAARCRSRRCRAALRPARAPAAAPTAAR